MAESKGSGKWHGMNRLFDDTSVVVFTDGGARGNPGPAAIGAVIGKQGYGIFIGNTTNNIAEYQAVIFALKKLKALVGAKRAQELSIEVRMDSELLVRQFNGKYKIKDKELQPLFVEVWNARLDFGSVKFVHIPREKNKAADKLVNEALDARL